jgi:hypothetical protein
MRPGRICWYHNFGGCSKTEASCKHEHRKLPKAEADLLYKPAGAVPKAKAAPAAPAVPAVPALPDAAAKAKAKAKAKAAPQNILWCRAFLTEKGCPNNAADCIYPHLDDASVKLVKAKLAMAKAKAKAKAAEG